MRKARQSQPLDKLYPKDDYLPRHVNSHCYTTYGTQDPTRTSGKGRPSTRSETLSLDTRGVSAVPIKDFLFGKILKRKLSSFLPTSRDNHPFCHSRHKTLGRNISVAGPESRTERFISRYSTECRKDSESKEKTFYYYRGCHV